MVPVMRMQNSMLAPSDLQYRFGLSTGTGLPQEMITSLFKPFNTTKKAGQGTGLGLYLSREIAMKHNGTIRGENRPEGGARFVLKIPVIAQQRAAA
jgi:signal transduction histidine kinase